MPDINFNDTPWNYALCLQEQCPAAGRCLRRLALPTVQQRDKTFRIVNPRLVVLSDQCPFFRDSTPVRYARGFKGMQARMLPSQYGEFTTRLRQRFGRNPFYVLRRGEKACTPDDIAYIRKALSDMGLPPFDFDSYEERINWDD